MNEIKYIIAREHTVALSARDADKLIDRHDGTAALLFLYLLRRGGSFSMEEAAQRLRLSVMELRRGAEALAEMGLLEIHGHLEPAEELPEYTSQAVQQRSMESPEFTALVQEVQYIYGRTLSSTELRLLFGIYDYLGLPPEVVMLLVSYCKERTARQQGPGRLPTMRSVEREAYAWANREIHTLEMAELHLSYLNRLETELAGVKAVIGIRDRELSGTERKYVERWISLGFQPEVLAIAYDKTVMKTGKLQWKYMDSIVNSWHGKGLHTADEIARGDTISPNSGKGQTAPVSGNQGDLQMMQKLLDKVKNS